MAGLFTKLALGCYFLATLHYLILLASEKKRKGKLGKIALGTTIAGFSAQSIAIITQTVQYGHIPFSTARASISFFVWAIVLVYLFIETKYKIEIIGSFVLPLVLLAAIYASLLPAQAEPIVSYNKGLFLALHGSLAFIGFALFSVAVCASTMYIVQERQLKTKHQGRIFYKLPSLEVLDRLSYKCISIGFPIYTISVILGMIWAVSTRASATDWRFQEIWWFFIWLAYAILLQARVTAGWRGKRAAYVTITVFVLACIPLLI